jgi:hypothetical protein
MWHKLFASLFTTVLAWTIFPSDKYLASYAWDVHASLYLKYLLLLSDFNQNLNIFIKLSKVLLLV